MPSDVEVLRAIEAHLEREWFAIKHQTGPAETTVFADIAQMARDAP